MKLFEGVDAYVEGRRIYGAAYPKGIQTLNAFCRYMGDISLDTIKQRQVAAFLDGPVISEATWQNKYKYLRNFFLFWLARNAISDLPLPLRRPPVGSPFVPYIYSRAEIRRLLAMIRIGQKNSNCKIDVRTVRVLILFLYGTGALLSDALTLRRDGLDFRRRTITIRNSRPYRSRTIPMCPDLYKVLRRYHATNHPKDTASAPFLFLNRNGEALTEYAVETTFRRLLRVSGVTRRDGIASRPRLHDLRHTFAVHRIDGWIKHGADLNRMLPALSVYMGRHGLGSSDRYLTLSPERFRAQLNKLSPRQSKRKWRDKPGLIKFLAKL
jgi:site-specific recombinase XerD